MALDGGTISDRNGLGQALIGQLQTAKDLIANLDDADYSGGAGSIGAHFRHNLNFVEAVIAGISSRSIDYANRSRDLRIETERLVAIERIDQLIVAIVGRVFDLEMPLTITSEIDPAIQHSSSLGRELEFVVSHTIHHHAMIKERLQAEGIQPDPNFGVAPSTLEYWNSSRQ
ncbi:MAG: hypothetical protein ABL984_09120 [Pyrinomonadaceae bacterium]